MQRNVPWLCLGGAGTLGCCWGQLGFGRWGKAAARDRRLAYRRAWVAQEPWRTAGLSLARLALAGSRLALARGSSIGAASSRTARQQIARPGRPSSSILMHPFQGDGQMEEARQGGVGC